MTRKVTKSTVVHCESIVSVNVEEACQICQVDVELLHELVIEGVFEFSAQDASFWLLDAHQLATLKKAARLHQDLGINPPGIALVLELMAQLEGYNPQE